MTHLIDLFLFYSKTKNKTKKTKNRNGFTIGISAHHVMACPIARRRKGSDSSARVRRFRHSGTFHFVDSRYGARQSLQSALPANRIRLQIQRYFRLILSVSPSASTFHEKKRTRKNKKPLTTPGPHFKAEMFV